MDLRGIVIESRYKWLTGGKTAAFTIHASCLRNPHDGEAVITIQRVYVRMGVCVAIVLHAL